MRALINKQCIACSHNIQSPFSWKEIVNFSLFQCKPYLPINEWLCQSCTKELPLISTDPIAICNRCSKTLNEIPEKYVHNINGRIVCYDCKRWLDVEGEMDMSLIHHNRSVLLYNAWTQSLINQFKFRGDEQLKYFFASLIIEHFEKLFNPKKFDFIVPIPLSINRLSERGFNQSHIICQHLAQYYHIPYAKDVLIRQSSEEKQSQKNRNERLEKMFERFLNNSTKTVDINNKVVLLFDDIYTTGATLHAAAYTLRRIGAKQIFTFTLAR